MVEQRAGAGGEVAAGGTAHDADARGVDLELGSARTDEPHGAQDILQRCRVAELSQAVLGRGSDAQRAQPVGILHALALIGEQAVATTGAMMTAVPLGRWIAIIDGQRGLGDMGDAPPSLVLLGADGAGAGTPSGQSGRTMGEAAKAVREVISSGRQRNFIEGWSWRPRQAGSRGGFSALLHNGNDYKSCRAHRAQDPP